MSHVVSLEEQGKEMKTQLMEQKSKSESLAYKGFQVMWPPVEMKYVHEMEGVLLESFIGKQLFLCFLYYSVLCLAVIFLGFRLFGMLG